jgi:DNA-binding MarR family transcriptional regulator
VQGSIFADMTILDHLGPLLGRAHEAHRAAVAEELGRLGLSPKGFGALTVLEGEGPLPQVELARRQGIDRTTMVAIVDELEGLGAVRRERDPRDRRAYALELTPAGRRLLERARPVLARAEEEFLAPLPAGDRERLREALRLLVEAHASGAPASSSSARMR